MTLSNDSKITGAAETGYKSEQILQGAMRVFLQHGYAGTSMDRVAGEAKVSKHTIYSHFQNKHGLFTALIERLVIRHFQVEFGCELPIEEPPDCVLRRLAKIVLGGMDDPEYIAFIRLMIAESGKRPDLAQLYMQEVVQCGNQILHDYFRSHPDLSLPDPEMTSHIFFGSLVTFILHQEVLHGKQTMPISQERLIDSLVDLILSYSAS